MASETYLSSAARRERLPAILWWSAAAIAAVIGFSRTSFGLALPAIKHDLPGSYYVYGWVASANFAGYLVGNIALPAVLRRINDRGRANAIALVALAITIGAQALCQSLWAMAACRALNGLAQAAVLVFSVSVALEAVRQQRRGLASGIIWMGAGIGIALVGLSSPAMLSAHPALSWRALSLVMALATLALAPRFLAPIPSASSEDGALASAGIGTIEKRAYVIITIAYGLFGIAFIVFFTYFTAFARHAGVSPGALGFVWSVAGVIGGLGAMLWGRVYDRIGVWAAPCSMWLAAIGALAIVTSNTGIQAVGAVLFCSSSIGFAALVSVLIHRYTTARDFARAFTIATIVFAIGQLAAGPPAGQIADRFGLQTTMFIVAGAAAAAALVTQLNVSVKRTGRLRSRRHC